MVYHPMPTDNGRGQGVVIQSLRSRKS